MVTEMRPSKGFLREQVLEAFLGSKGNKGLKNLVNNIILGNKEYWKSKSDFGDQGNIPGSALEMPVLLEV